MNEEILAYIHEWDTLTKELEVKKAREIELRKYLSSVVLEGTTSGSATKIYGDIEVKATAKLNYSVSKAVLDNVFTELDDTEKQALRYKPEVALKEFKKLPSTSILRVSVVTVKPGMPAFEIIT